MKRLLLIGRSGSGKTTLTQALRGDARLRRKTQTVDYGETLIDSPGEYAQTHSLGCALALYAYEADVVGLVVRADETYSLFPPNITCMVNRPVVGIVTGADLRDAAPARAAAWLQNSGCERIFLVSAETGLGLPELHAFLADDGEGKAPAGCKKAKTGAYRKENPIKQK